MNIILAKVKIRRGTEAQRQGVVLEQGELAYIVDTKRVFVGDGVLSGGGVIGSVSHLPLNTAGARVGLNTAFTGDIVVENSLMYQLTGSNYAALSSWCNISSKVDNIGIEYDANNKLQLKSQGITYDKLSLNIASSGLSVGANGLQLDYDDATIGKVGNTISVKDAGITHVQISNTSLGDGLSGGSGSQLAVNANPSQFSFPGGVLNFTGTVTPGAIDYTTQIQPSIAFGVGLFQNNGTQQLETTINAVDSTITNTSGQIGLADAPNGSTGSSTNIFGNIVSDNKGRVLLNTTSIMGRVSGTSTLSVDTPLSAFTGYPGQVSQGRITNQGLSVVTAVSASPGGLTTSVMLSSAGFLFFPAAVTIDGAVVDRFAIPVFNY